MLDRPVECTQYTVTCFCTVRGAQMNVIWTESERCRVEVIFADFFSLSFSTPCDVISTSCESCKSDPEAFFSTVPPHSCQIVDYSLIIAG